MWIEMSLQLLRSEKMSSIYKKQEASTLCVNWLLMKILLEEIIKK